MSKSPVFGIERTPGVCGGDACIAQTRIPVWVLVRAFKLGGRDEDILECYPALSRHDLDSAVEYYELYPAEIEQQIADNESLERSELSRTKKESHEPKEPSAPFIRR